MRYFEKISFAEFKKTISDSKELYDSFLLPKRETKTSAGYDFFAIVDLVIKPNETALIPLGVKACMNNDEVLFLVLRSSQGFKYNLRLVNQVGVIDSDYYNNETNEGHMSMKIKNEGEKEYIIKKGDKILQGIFVKYLTVDNEQEIVRERKGGIGSTNGEKNEKYKRR